MAYNDARETSSSKGLASNFGKILNPDDFESQVNRTCLEKRTTVEHRDVNETLEKGRKVVFNA